MKRLSCSKRWCRLSAAVVISLQRAREGSRAARTMNALSNNLGVWVGDKLVCVKVAGRANFSGSVDLKTLVNSMWAKGYHHFVLDLSECLLMDSTFLGVLAGLGLKLNGTNGQAQTASGNGNGQRA